MRSTLSLCVLALVVVVPLAPIASQPPPAAGDVARLWLPLQTRVANAIAHTGNLPAWDPAGFGGRPLLANPQAGIWYPPVWLFWSLRSPQVFGWLTSIHLLGGAWGVSRLARACRCDDYAAIAAGAFFALNPYLIAQVCVGHDPQVWAAAYFPWIFLCALRWRRGNADGLFILPVTLGLSFLTGHPQPAYYATLALGVWALAALFATHTPRRQRFGLGLMLSIVVTIGLIAFAWLPIACAQPWTLRAARVALHETQPYSLTLAGLFDTTHNSSEAVLPFTALAAALLAMGLPRLLRSPAGRAWTCLLAVSLIMAAGRYLGLYALLYQAVPGIDRFRVPSRALFLSALATSMLLAIALAALRNRSRLRSLIVVLLLIELTVNAWHRGETAHHVPPTADTARVASYCRSHQCRVAYEDGTLAEAELARLGVESSDLYDWFQIQHAADLYQTLYGIDGRGRWLEMVDPLGSWDRNRRQHAAANLMSVGLIARRGENGTLRWRENPSALPRAYVVGQALRVPDAHHALEWLTWFDPRSAVILPTDPLTDAPLTRRQPFKPATYRMLNSDEVEIGVSTDGPCFLVVTDTWMPGWTATDNGRALPILRGNQAQRVVALSTGGSHRVVMRYEAPGLFAGAAVSCLSAAGWLLIGWRLQMRASSVRIGTSPNVA